MPQTEIHDIVTPRRVAKATRLPTEFVRRVLSIHKRLIDGLVAMDIVVLTDIGAMGQRGDPLARLLNTMADAEIERLTPIVDEWLAQEFYDQCLGEVIHDALGPDAPGTGLITGHDLFDEIAELVEQRRPASEETLSAVHQVLATFWRLVGRIETDAWWVHDRPSLEVDFETWLEKNLDRLAPLGFPVAALDSPARRQWRTPDGKRADLICIYTQTVDDSRPGDLLVIENKVVPAHYAVIEQIRGYMRAAESTLADPGQRVEGLILATGQTERFRVALDQEQDDLIHYASLADIGYFDDLFGTDLIRR